MPGMFSSSIKYRCTSLIFVEKFSRPLSLPIAPSLPLTHSLSLSVSLPHSFDRCERLRTAVPLGIRHDSSRVESSRSLRIEIGSARHAGRLASPSRRHCPVPAGVNTLGRTWFILRRDLVRASLTRRSRDPDTRPRRPGANRRRHHRGLSRIYQKYCARTDDVWDSVKIRRFVVPCVHSQS